MPGRKLISGFLAAVALFCSLLPGLQAAEASASEVVTVAVSDTLLDAEAHEGMKALLARQLPQDWLVNVVPIQGADIVTGIEKYCPDCRKQITRRQAAERMRKKRTLVTQ